MDPLQHITRRHLFSQCALGLGSIALASLLTLLALVTLVLKYIVERRVRREIKQASEGVEE